MKSEKSKCSNRFRTFTKDLPLVRLDDCKIFMQFSSVFTKLSTIQKSVKQEEGKEKRERERQSIDALQKKRKGKKKGKRERALSCLPPYHAENTPSRPIWQVKQRWARLVLGSETAWESRVWKAFLHYLVKFMNIMELSLISYLLLPLVFVYKNKYQPLS